MAGVVLTIGSSGMCLHKNLYKTFLENKFIESSTQKKEENYYISKFKRVHQRDYNYIDDKDISIYCVGNIAYKNSMGKDAIKFIKEALKENKLHEIVSKLDGHFILIIVNHYVKKIYLITDHGGFIHIYKYFDGKSVYLTTSSLSLSKNINVTLDINSVVQFLRCDSIGDYDTIYSEIKLLEPGCIYQYEMHEDIVMESKKYYWKSPTVIEERMDFEEATEMWAGALMETCNKLPKERIICDLTGGYDTRSILATMLQYEDLKLDQFSTFIFGPEYSQEVKIAKQISSNMNLPIMHTQLPDGWEEEYSDYLKESILLTDGEENACKYAAIMVANDKKSKNYEYSINGLGGPIVKSFNWIQEFNIKKKPANINRFIYMRTMKSEFINDVFKKEWIERIIDVDKALKESYLNIIGDMDRENTFNTLQLDNIDFRQRERRWGGRTISSSNRIINVISPLYFKRCIEAGMVIPPRFKKNKKLLRNVITRLHPQIAKEKMLNGAPCELISAKNFYKFSPMLTSLIKKSIRIGFKKLFKKNVFISNSIEYPRYKWYGKLFSNRKNFFINDFENWASAPLYVQSNLKEFVENAKGPGFKYYTQLEKMITLELRIRGDRVKNLV